MFHRRVLVCHLLSHAGACLLFATVVPRVWSQTIEPPAAQPTEGQAASAIDPPPAVEPQVTSPAEGPSPAPVGATTAPAAAKIEDDEIRAPAWIQDGDEPKTGKSVEPPSQRATLRKPQHQWLAGLTTSSGAQGLLRVLSADTGIAGQLRLQFAGEFASGSDVIIRGDENTRLGGAISGSYSPFVGLELFSSLLASSNKNKRVCSGDFCQSEGGRVDPEVIRSFGDLILGGKLGRQVSSDFALAAYSHVRLYSATDGMFFNFGATSIALGGLATWDLGPRLPLRLHANIGFVIDNSSNLQNFDGVGQPSELAASFAYGLGRSRLQNAIAIETTPLAIAKAQFISPFVEYQHDWITSSSNSRFSDFTSPACETSGRPCQENRDQQRVALGVRGHFSGLWNVTGAVDFGFRSVGFPYGSPQAPITMLLQVGRPFGLGGTAAPVVVVTLPRPGAPPAQEEPDDGLITGIVVNAVDQKPIFNAVVALVGRPRSRVATDMDGTFTTHDVAPAAVNIEVSAVGFETQLLRAQVSPGLATDVEVELVPRLEAVVRGQLADTNGKRLVGRLLFSGSGTLVVASDLQGRYEATLPPGLLTVRAEVPGHLYKEQQFTLEANAKLDVNFVLRPRKDVAAAEYMAGRGLILRLPIGFEVQRGGLPVALHPASLQVLDEIVHVLVTRPGITKLEVQTHWDSGRIAQTDPLTLTTMQAQAIADYLQAQGIAADRLVLVPKGATESLGKVRLVNRRVVIEVKDEL